MLDTVGDIDMDEEAVFGEAAASSEPGDVVIVWQIKTAARRAAALSTAAKQNVSIGK